MYECNSIKINIIMFMLVSTVTLLYKTVKNTVYINKYIYQCIGIVDV